MHAGVLRDMEQQRIKKERKADFDMQRALEAEYRKVQKVPDGTGAGSRAEGVWVWGLRRAQRQICLDLEVFWNEDETESLVVR